MKEITKKVYFSDLLDKEFDTPEECDKAEKAKVEADKAIATVASHKKELANSIESAEDKIDNAKKEYTDIRNKYERDFRELNGEYTRKLDALKKERDNALSEKLKEIRELGNERYTALCNYNKEFGVYKKYLDDKEADKELRKITSAIFDFPNLWDMFINW